MVINDGLVMVFLVFTFQVEHIIREENMMAAQEIIELFSELITVRLPIVESQRLVFKLVIFWHYVSLCSNNMVCNLYF